jgi:hypothetical protein
MDQTFEKPEAMAAAQKVIAAIKAERARRTAAFDAKSRWARFWDEFAHSGRYSAENYGSRQETTARRIWFKAQCTEDKVLYLTDAEIDSVIDFWGAK